MTSFCTNCGAPITPGSAFCTSCGTATQPPVTQPLPYPPAPPTGNGVNQRVLILGLVGAGAIAIITVLLVVLLGGNGPDDAVKNTFKAYADGDCDRVVELRYFDESSPRTKDQVRGNCELGVATDFDVEVLGTEDHKGSLPSGVSDAADVKVRVSAQILGRKVKENSIVTVYKVDGEWLVYKDDSDD